MVQCIEEGKIYRFCTKQSIFAQLDFLSKVTKKIVIVIQNINSILLIIITWLQILGGYFSLLEFCVLSNLCKVYMDLSASAYAVAALVRLAPLIIWSYNKPIFNAIT